MSAGEGGRTENKNLRLSGTTGGKEGGRKGGREEEKQGGREGGRRLDVP